MQQCSCNGSRRECIQRNLSLAWRDRDKQRGLRYRVVVETLFATAWQKMRARYVVRCQS